MNSELVIHSSPERPKITRELQSDFEGQPKPRRIEGEALSSIHVVGALSDPSNFKPWKAYSDTGDLYRPNRPVTELTVGLHETYSSGSGSKSAQKVKRWIFESHNPLGEGAHGCVYPVRDEKTGCSAVGKINRQKKSSYEAAVEEYQNLYAWQAIPHVVRVLGGRNTPSESQKIIYMERADSTLGQVLNQRKKLPFQEVVSILKQLLEMHVAASKKALVHADLKPQNIGYQKGEVIVFDLGLAHCLKHYFYDKNSIQTLNYRAPEVILDKSYSPNIDLWSIGCIVYEIFCGKKFIVAKSDDLEGRNEVLLQMGEKLGLPSSSYFKDEEFKRAFFKRAGSQPLANELRKEAKSRGLSENETEHFIALLKKILKFENRIRADAALEQCNALLSNGLSNISELEERKSTSSAVIS